MAQPVSVRTAFLTSILAVLAVAVSVPAAAYAAATPVPPIAAAAPDFGFPTGHYYSQASGEPAGHPELGFTIANDSAASLWTGFQKLGGVTVLGYPNTQRFELNGFLDQGSQRGVLQWQPATKSVALLNVFDVLHDAGQDGWLLSQFQIPPPVQLREQGFTFKQIEAGRLALLNGNAAIKKRYLSNRDAVQQYGLPTSAPVDYGPVVVLRAQRVAFQYWKVATPWAKAGEVTLVNGGDIAKQSGILPAAALQPGAPPVLDGQAAARPWSGWWWPASLQPYQPPYMFAANGPLAKYDAYVVATGAPSPGVQAWERAHIVWNDPQFSWAGHCNGWAASVLLEPEPQAPVVAHGVHLSVADQKGLLADYHFADAPLWEYGSRDTGLVPADLQRMVVNWLGAQHTGFVIDDYATNNRIESFPVYRYHMLYYADPVHPGETHVQLTLWMASYNVDPNFVGLRNFPGDAGQRFDYFIYGPLNNPTGGGWEGVSVHGVRGHPRFIWYPRTDVRNAGQTLTDPALSYTTILQMLGRPLPKPAPATQPAPSAQPAAVGAMTVPWSGLNSGG